MNFLGSSTCGLRSVAFSVQAMVQREVDVSNMIATILLLNVVWRILGLVWKDIYIYKRELVRWHGKLFRSRRRLVLSFLPVTVFCADVGLCFAFLCLF